MTWLLNLKLSLQQWLVLGTTAAVGVLLVLLKMKDSKLHKAQLALLELQYSQATNKQDSVVAAARQAYKEALEAYQNEKP